MQFIIPSHDPARLDKATRVANEFIAPYKNEAMVGIVLLGAIPRGYFDHSSDIDIAMIKKRAAQIDLPGKFLEVEGLEVQIWLEDYESECTVAWDMPKRWTYAQGQIAYDPEGKIARLLAKKVPLRADERKWLLMSGLCLSEWYINRLTDLWVQRGSMISAQHMFGQGLNYFFDLLFGLNNELVPDMKWKYYCVEQLPRLPARFRERIQEVMLLHAFTMEELSRRKAAFMEMWRELLPIVEQEVGMSYAEIEKLV